MPRDPRVYVEDILEAVRRIRSYTERIGPDEFAGSPMTIDAVVRNLEAIGLAAAADPSVASFEPSATALASFVALVDPVHVRVFIRPSRPADLVLAAKIGKAVEAAANQALSLELVAVADDLSEPKALLAENAVTAAPEIIVYWLNQEVGRMHPEAGSPVETELADYIFQARVQIAQEMILDHEFFKFTFHKDLLPLDCKRCHGPD
jgi:hypothetical protein